MLTGEAMPSPKTLKGENAPTTACRSPASGPSRRWNDPNNDVPATLDNPDKPQDTIVVRFSLDHIVGSNATSEPSGLAHAVCRHDRADQGM
jgi:hypothetical protein